MKGSIFKCSCGVNHLAKRMKEALLTYWLTKWNLQDNGAKQAALLGTVTVAFLESTA